MTLSYSPTCYCIDLVVSAHHLGQSVLASTPKPENARSHELSPPHADAEMYGTVCKASHHLRLGTSFAAICAGAIAVWLYQRPIRMPMAMAPKMPRIDVEITRNLTAISVSVL